MNDEPISDRLLERLQLGELGEAEATHVLRLLEERGESHRLERLIENDEEFLARYPSGTAAALIRERLRRRERARIDDSMAPHPGWRRVAVPIAAGMALFAIAIAYQAGQEQAATKAPEMAAMQPALVSETSGQREEAAPSAPDQQSWNGLLDWTVAQHGDGLRAIACSPGESMSFEAGSIARVSIDQSDLIEVRPDDDGRKLTMTCRAVGLANINLIEGDGSVSNLIIRIAPPHEDLPGEERQYAALLDRALVACGALEGMALKVVLENRGFAAMTLVGGGSTADRKCVKQAVQDLPKWNDRDHPGFTLLSREW